MANQEHLDILAKGVQVWNEWRSRESNVLPDLSRGSLSGAGLSNADLTFSDLRYANLTHANLTGARLSGADLYGADLDHANLTNADLSGADLSGAGLSNADLTGASLYLTTFAFCNLSTAKGLDTVQHEGPSEIGVQTLYSSQGKIPESFLRGAGVPDNFITYMKSMTGAAIEFYSCFISYATKDQSFADRLYADLQAKGVPCWFAPEDLKIGDKFRSRIDESIRVQDKLLLVLSAASIGSPWVEKEVEAAFERERREGRSVLFPIRLDNTVMDTSEAWAADIRRTRHIGNFTGWTDDGAYMKSFDRLLRDLKAEEDKKAAESAGSKS